MVVAPLLWSTAGAVTRQLEAARSFEVTFWRSLFTVLSLLFILPTLRGPSVFSDMLHGKRGLWLSGLCWGVMFTAFMVALTLTTVANVLVTMSIGPLLTALVARVAIGHKIASRTWGAIVFAGAGIAWIYGGQMGQGQWLGTLVALCVPIAAAVNWTISQHAHERGEDVDLVPAVMIGAVASTLVTLPLALPFQATPHDVAWLAGLGLTQLAIPCVLATLAARVLKAPEISLLGLLEVIFGILLAWLVASEAPDSRVLSGGALVLSALVANEILGWRARQG
ncbi:MAG: hypothetical protein RJA34_2064 [Pseudomonadota bacterium]